jgi:sn-glycerol 3-phosphate transport system permease protein
MVERRPLLTVLTHVVLILGVLVVAFPLYLTFVASTHTTQDLMQAPMPLLPGHHLVQNYLDAWNGTGTGAGSKAPVARMMTVSLISALIIALGKIAISLLSAFAIVYFRFPFRNFVFWAIFITLMLPVEVRIGPTYKVVADFGMLDTYAGLTVPLIASATATFLFRQFFLTVPEELVEAARMDGAGPMRFFRDVLLPLSMTSIAALFVIQFIYGWNQYLWPLLVTTNESMYPVVIGIKRMISGGDSEMQWNVVMATAMMAMIPPAMIVILMQKWFVKGLVDTEK